MALKGNEIVKVTGVAANGQPAAAIELVTTQAIANLANTEDSSFIPTAVTNTSGTTLTAAALVSGEITRTGPSANFSDATDTAAHIAAASGVEVGSGFFVYLKNATAYTQTITAGVGVTLPTTVIIPPFSNARYFVSVVSATAVTFLHIETSAISVGGNQTNPALTALTTVGAGTITAASFSAGLTARGGTQTGAITDTTDIAANIIAATANIVGKIGASFLYRYVNNTVFPATLTGGTGVTVSGVTVIPANSWADYLVTYTAAATLTMVGIAQGYLPNSGTFVNNGTSAVTTANAAVTAGSNIIITLKTVGGTVGAIPHVETITPGTGFTTIGTASDSSTYNYTILG